MSIKCKVLSSNPSTGELRQGLWARPAGLSSETPERRRRGMEWAPGRSPGEPASPWGSMPTAHQVMAVAGVNVWE